MQEDWEVKRSEPDGNHRFRLLQEIIAFVLLEGTDLLLIFCEKV